MPFRANVNGAAVEVLVNVNHTAVHPSVAYAANLGDVWPVARLYDGGDGLPVSGDGHQI